MRVVVIGTGYVGLVTGTCLSEMGHHVICLDIDERKVEELKKGVIPFFEPGLEELVRRNYSGKRLAFTTSYKEAFQSAQVAFIAVDTPSLPDGQADISRVIEVARSLADYVKPGLTIVTKSTVPPGTTFRIKEEISKSVKNCPFSVASNPEFLKEGSAVQDCMKPDRIIVGVEEEETAKKLHELYSPFMLNHDRFFVMDVLSSELTKYAANAMLATRISFMNELSRFCDLIGADIQQIRKGIGSDKRIGTSFLYAGVGYGGSCLPKDVKALAAQSKSLGYNMSLLESVDGVNREQKKWFLEKIYSHFGDRKGTLAIWGLSFKPDTDDLREAPSLFFIKELVSQGYVLKLYDPISIEKVKRSIPSHDRIIFCGSELEAALDADGILLLTEWKPFRLIDMDEVLKKMRGNLFFDGRNQYHPEEMARKGFIYKSIGQPSFSLEHVI